VLFWAFQKVFKACLLLHCGAHSIAVVTVNYLLSYQMEREALFPSQNEDGDGPALEGREVRKAAGKIYFTPLYPCPLWWLKARVK
jgi:hypothetical protein